MTTTQLSPAQRSLTRARRVISFIGYFTYEFLKSNALVLLEIFRPRPQARPAIVAVPVRGNRRVEIVSMANLITLTPGTLTLEVALDPPTLYVHGMFAGDPQQFVADLHRLEDRLLAAMRPVAAEPDHAGAAERAERARRAGDPQRGWSR